MRLMAKKREKLRRGKFLWKGPNRGSARSYKRGCFVAYRCLVARIYSRDYRCQISDSGLVTRMAHI